MSALIVKQGQTFVFHATISDRNGAVVGLSGYQISSQIRDALGNQVDTLKSRLPVGRVGVVNLWSDTGTTGWPVGRLFCDLHFVRPDGVIQFTETFSIIVAAPITRPGATS
ncbi:hypothetical protein HKD24_06110 [Gluconobacter sp. LMG 31484]|uniref:Uncharacterized protein n=1 Tax=Gluconobacter vitians TaxID=2728102 RepID=A0ABR9Y4C0_9PROT|nr:hypothetical protein [Gluconobacter vitians]MBF0858786.1 hypothetical protein [Gluconobacter vitians]